MDKNVKLNYILLFPGDKNQLYVFIDSLYIYIYKIYENNCNTMEEFFNMQNVFFHLVCFYPSTHFFNHFRNFIAKERTNVMRSSKMSLNLRKKWQCSVCFISKALFGWKPHQNVHYGSRDVAILVLVPCTL